MGDGQLLLGVSHSMWHLNDVVDFLKQEQIKKRKVMLELAKKRVPSQPKRSEFFLKLGKYITKNSGILIYGDDESILERAYAKNLELCEKMKEPGLSIMEWAELHAENRYEVPHIERDPHFLKVIQEQNPDIVILGRRHIPYLVENHYSSMAVPPRVIYIPEKE